MTTQQYSAGFLRKRKMMLVLPLLVLPFLTMAFWALGGGKININAVVPANVDNGLNLNLPNSSLKASDELDKMEYYEKAAADSAKIKARIKDDAYFNLKTNLSDDSLNQLSNAGEIKENSTTRVYTPQEKVPGASGAEIKVYEKLQQINTALENAKAATSVKIDSKRKTDDLSGGIQSSHNNRMATLMQTLDNQTGNNDSEMLQINAMLEKVIDIQHPERVNEKFNQNASTHNNNVLQVGQIEPTNNGFYSQRNVTSAMHPFDDDTSRTNKIMPRIATAIEAVVHETQTLVSGSTIKLRLLTDIEVDGVRVPKANFLYGIASLSGNRLSVSINSIRYQDHLLPVSLSLYDMDGQPGINIPGAVTRDVAKQSSDNALQSIALNSLNPSVGTQAATAGIETAKALISKKIKLVQVTVKTGYHVLLENSKNK